MKEQLIELTKTLCTFQSDKNNKAQREECVSFIEDLLTRRGPQDIVIEKIKSGDITSLYAHCKREGPQILLCGHIDVIQAEEKQFRPQHDDQFIYARGAGDMKAGVAILIEAFLQHTDKNIALLLTADEEIGGMNGAGVVVKKINPDFVIITEPSDNTICLNQKGGMWVDLEVTGPGGHASRPWLAHNAVDILMNILSRLRKSFPHPENRLWANTMNIGAIQGGDLRINENIIENGSANVIADRAKVTLDFRLIETTMHDEVMKLIQEAIEQEALSKEYTITCKDRLRIPHLHTPEENLFVQQLIRASTQAIGSAELRNKHAASDGRFFSSKGIPTILTGPTSINHHALNEHVDIETMVKCFAIINKFLEEV